VSRDRDLFSGRPLEFAVGRVSIKGGVLEVAQDSRGTWQVWLVAGRQPPVPLVQIFTGGEALAREDVPPAVAVALPSVEEFHSYLFASPGLTADEHLAALDRWIISLAAAAGAVVFDPPTERVIWPEGIPPPPLARRVLVDVLELVVFASRVGEPVSWLRQLFAATRESMPDAAPQAYRVGDSRRRFRYTDAEVPRIAAAASEKIIYWETSPPAFSGTVYVRGPVRLAEVSFELGVWLDDRRRRELDALVEAWAGLAGAFYLCGVVRRNLVYRDGGLYLAGQATGVSHVGQVIGGPWPGLPRRGPLCLEWFGPPYLPFIEERVPDLVTCRDGLLASYGIDSPEDRRRVPDELLLSPIPTRPAPVIPSGL
jgi:hypothetical protein